GGGRRRPLEHLPVAGDQHAATRSDGIAAMPGSSLPSSSSSEAPPPVEIHEIRSATPASCTARTESPPPTTVKPSQTATARATAKVPSANRGHPKTPTGAFKTAVRAARNQVATTPRAS